MATFALAVTFSVIAVLTSVRVAFFLVAGLASCRPFDLVIVAGLIHGHHAVRTRAA
jgi:hypothetical protein